MRRITLEVTGDPMATPGRDTSGRAYIEGIAVGVEEPAGVWITDADTGQRIGLLDVHVNDGRLRAGVGGWDEAGDWLGEYAPLVNEHEDRAAAVEAAATALGTPTTDPRTSEHVADADALDLIAADLQTVKDGDEFDGNDPEIEHLRDVLDGIATILRQTGREI